MLHQFTKSCVAAMLVTASPAFTKSKDNSNPCPPYDQGHEASASEMIAGYSAPACIKLKDDSWDIYTSGSFIYWQASQENMEIGLISRNDPEGRSIPGGDVPFSTTYVNNTNMTSPNFTFRPGFKVGLGANLNWDGWDVYSEYTWFHGSIASGVRPLNPSTAVIGQPNGEYLYPSQGASTSPGDHYYQNANQSWSLRMDFLDLSLARGYYSGTKLTVRPFFGVRGAWIRQNLTTTYNGSPGYLTELGYVQSYVSHSSASWGVGPRTGFESNWMVGRGFRFIGNGSGDILYTRYSTHSNQQIHNINTVPGTTNPITTNYSVSQEIDYLRTHLDFELGFGWGTYFSRNNYHIDLSATYGYQIFWDQNMFRFFADNATAGKSFAPSGNLYIHGLTANARFDF